MLLFVSIGSIYAADSSDSKLNDNFDDDFELDDDWGDEYDPDEDDEYGPDEDDETDPDDWGDEYDPDEEDEDFEDDDNYTDFYFLEFKITSYLQQYGNCSSFNWTESEHFQSEYLIYLSNPSNYTLNQSAEGYETYLKIFDSITSTFGDYNLTENETEYFKFMIIYYLNNYGNVSANYTWNESDDFANYTPPFWLSTCAVKGLSAIAMPITAEHYLNYSTPLNQILGNYTVGNSTSDSNSTGFVVPQEDSGWIDIVMLILMVILIVFIII